MALAEPDIDVRPNVPGRVRQLVATPVSALSFWSAIALPVVYVPLFVTGIESVEGLALFLGLFALHVLALVGGRSHRRADEE